MDVISGLFEGIAHKNSSSLVEGPVLIYGAGNTGKAVAKHLTLNHREVLAFIDQKSSVGSMCDGFPVLSLKQAIENYGANTSVLIAVHNRAVDMAQLIKGIKSIGFLNVCSMFDYASIFSSDDAFRYFLTDSLSLKSERVNAEKFYELLSDDFSKKLYLDLLKFRLYGDYFSCPLPTAKDQYSPEDIPRWGNPLRLIDCGAYNGDSIKLFESYGYKFESIVAFEPDLKNYQELVKNIDYPNMELIPCGVSNTAKTIKFNAGAGEGSRVSDDGVITIQMVSIDEAFSSYRANLIKMDIEGGEGDAILGAKKCIQKYRPGLALSAYHLPTDLWRLGLLIDEIDSGYNFYMRSHAYSSFDTVLYATPKEF